MRVAVLALALMPAAALAQERPMAPLKRAECTVATQMAAKPEPLRPRTLKDQPEAEAYLTVLRIEDGCDKPVKVRDYRSAGAGRGQMSSTSRP